MRSVFLSDVLAAARILDVSAAADSAALCRDIFREADVADRFTKRMDRPHPAWGRGTLQGAAARHPRIHKADFDDAAFCQSMIVVLEQLRKRPRGAHV